MERQPDDVQLVLADEAQQAARDLLTVEAWGGGLTLEAYLRRERRLRAVAVPRLGMRTWLLIDGGQAVLSSCETLAFPSVLRLDGVEQWGQSSGVASVFTERALRGRGHATRMLDLLSLRLTSEPGAQAVVLYSDVGAAQYTRSGFVPRLSHDWRWPPAPEGVVPRAALFDEGALAWRWAAHPVPAGRFLIHPTADMFDWFLERERIYCTELVLPRPLACGAALGRSLALFYAQPRDGRLWIHWLSATDAPATAALVTAARVVARDAGLSEVRLWEDPDGYPFPDGLEGGVRQTREGSLPMIRPLDPRLRPEDWRSIPRALWV